MIDHARRMTSSFLYAHCLFIRELSIRIAPKDHPWRIFASSARPMKREAAKKALRQPTPKVKLSQLERARFTRDLWGSIAGTGALIGPSLAGTLAALAATNQLPISF